MTNENIEPDGVAELEVTLSDVGAMRAFEFELTYDANRFEYLTVSADDMSIPGSALQVRVVEPGRLMMFNAFESAQTIADESVLAQLQFLVNGSFDQADPFQIARGLQINGLDLLTPMAETGSLLAVTAPKAFSLYQNFPNPFNPETLIRYDIAESVQVSLQVYNVLGQLVRTLVNEQQAAGRYSITWNGLDQAGVAVSSGVYFYQIQAGSYEQGKRLVLLK